MLVNADQFPAIPVWALVARLPLSDFIPEAIALGAAFAHGEKTGALLAILIALQNLPEGFNAYRELNATGDIGGKKLVLLLAACIPLGPLAGWVTPQSAQKLVDWKIDDSLRARIEELGRKANLGQLSKEEDAEYRAYLDDAEVISLMQAKARRHFFGTSG